MAVRVLCPAKVNLGLSILRKRDDGYHELETVFQAIDWEDILTVEVWEGTDELLVSGPFAEGVPADSSNLVFKAIDVLRTSHKIPALKLHLEKNIPHGAGLGGGSSDVAGLLVGVNELCGLDLSEAALEDAAAQVGSDTAFFVRGGAQWGRGRGEKLRPIPGSCPLPLLMAVPEESVSTRDAYGSLTAGDLGQAFDGVEVEAWIRNPDTPVPHLGNTFEAPISQRTPGIASALAWLRQEGALMAFLSGSGSACVGLFGSTQQAARAAGRCPSGLRECRVCRALDRGVIVDRSAN